MQPFNETESGFTATAGTLSNSSANQGLSFPIWGNPERSKINEMARFANAFMGGLS